MLLLCPRGARAYENGMVSKFRTLGVFAVCALLLASHAPCQEPEELTAWPGAIIQYELKNRLRVVLYKDSSFPVVSVVVAYRAGTMVEGRGQSGLAYLVENLMFEGSENVGPRQHFNFIQRAGGELNATTTYDRTVFYQTLPSNQLALALWLESDRMRSLAVNPGILEKVRGVIIDTFQKRKEQEAYFESYDSFDEILYQDFSYAHSLVGTGEDLRRFTVEDVLAFHNKFYVPNNAVLCIVGNIDILRTRELVSRYFDTIPPGDDAPLPAPPRIEQQKEIQRTWNENQASIPGFHLGYRFHPLQTGDVYTLRILEYILLRGPTSRLYSRLIRKDRLALDIKGDLEHRLSMMALKIFVICNNAYMADRSRRAILAEIEKIKANPVSASELRKIKNLFKMDYFKTLETTIGRALYLINAVFSDIPVDRIPDELMKHLSVPAATIRSLAQRHFKESNRVILLVEVK